MGMKKYKQLLENIGEMAKAVENLPENCREMVYRSLVVALLDEDDQLQVNSASAGKHTAIVDTVEEIDERNIAEELEGYYRRFSLDSATDMEFSAFLAYFFKRLAPPAETVDRIDESHYKMACMVTGKSLPKRISGTLNNAKNLKGYLDSHGSGVYSITAMGEHYVKHRLMKEIDE